MGEGLPTCSCLGDRVDSVDDDWHAECEVGGGDLMGNDVADGSNWALRQTAADHGCFDGVDAKVGGGKFGSEPARECRLARARPAGEHDEKRE